MGCMYLIQGPIFAQCRPGSDTGGSLCISSGQVMAQVYSSKISSLAIFSDGLVNAIIAMQAIQSYKELR